ncbi:MAG: AAA family ATPase [Candidatus Bathyarchaeia archaeon]|jgi:tetratricopeptide (TPR) repeat protein
MILTSGVLAEPILAGRERELGELQSLLNLAVEGKGTTVFISGEAGTGKTRLIKEFLNTAKQKHDLSTLTGSCLSNAAVPYFPFFEAFTGYFSTETNQENKPSKIQNEEQEIKSWLMGPAQAEKLERHEALAPQVWKDQTFVAVTQTLSAISDEKPVVLFLEDVHWADSASLALMNYIGRAISSKRILVLATFRSEALTTDAEGHPHPLVETLRQMRREDLYKEIKLSNLDQVSVSAIARSMLGGNLQQELAEKLAKESQGNPLYIVESLRMLHERDSLIKEHNQWRLSINELGIPAKIKDIILQRLSTLMRNQRRVLDAASVIGEKFDVELLGAVLGQDSLEVLETLNAIAQSTALILCMEGSFRFDHAKSRDAIYEEIPLALKKGYHDRIAEQMESASKKNKVPFSDLAYHYAQAGNKEKAVKYALAAGQDAVARWSNQEAIKHFSYVLETIGDNLERFDEKAIALEGLGDAYSANNNFNQAAEVFEQLAGITMDVARLRALRKAMFAAFYKGDLQKLIALTQKAEENAAADRLESARVLDQKATILGLQGQHVAALEFEEKALRIFEEEYSLPDAARSLLFGSFVASTQGQLEKGIASALRALALYNELGDFRSQIEAFHYMGYDFDICTLNKEAYSLYAKVIEFNEQLKMGAYVILIATYVSWGMSLPPEDIAEAISKTLKALEYSEKTDSYLFLGWIYDTLILQYTLAGDMVHAEEYFGKLMSLPQEVFLDGTTKLWLGLAKPVYSAGKSQFEESNRLFKDYFEFIKINMPNPLMELLTRRAYAWALSKQGRVEEAETQLKQTQQLIETTRKRFSHVDVHASLMTFTHPEVNQTFEMRLDLINVSTLPGSIVKVENLLIPGLKIVDFPADCVLKDGLFEFKESRIGPFEVKTLKLTLQATKPGVFNLNPNATYVNDLGETKTCKLNPVVATVKPAQPSGHIVEGRISSGFDELDDLLQGGIPENYMVILASPSCDERELLIKRFLEAGAEAGETTFFLTAKTENAKDLAEKHQSNFSLFICNPQAEAMEGDLPNIYKLKGVDSLTDIDIALTKYFRALDPAKRGPKRACIEILSDVLLQHHAIATRKWLSGLLPNLKSKGFTTLAIIDPNMHPPEETQAAIGLFDGEIRIYEKETTKGSEKILKIRKLYNQKYLENELTLTKEKFGSS